LRFWQRGEPVEQRHAQLVQARERELHLGLDAHRAHRAEPGCRFSGMLQQRGLADAGFAAHHERDAAPGPCLGEQPFDRLAFGAPTQEHRLVLLRTPAGVRQLRSPSVSIRTRPVKPSKAVVAARLGGVADPNRI
jgi:hypothetical protein